MRLIRSTVLSACFLAPGAGAEVTLLTFDDLGLPHGTVITDQYASRGVLFSPQNGELQLRSASHPLFPDEPIGLAEIPYFTSVIIATFPAGATSAGAWIDFGSVGGVRIEAFDGPGATGALLTSALTQSEGFLGVQHQGIRSVRFSNAFISGQTSYLIDHFMFEPVPAPGSFAVFVCVAMAMTRRRAGRRGGPV